MPVNGLWSLYISHCCKREMVKSFGKTQSWSRWTQMGLRKYSRIISNSKYTLLSPLALEFRILVDPSQIRCGPTQLDKDVLLLKTLTLVIGTIQLKLSSFFYHFYHCFQVEPQFTLCLRNQRVLLLNALWYYSASILLTYQQSFLGQF